jgi:hypothetical protein
MAEPVWGDELPLTTVESFVAALVEAGPEVAEHMVKAANELLLAAQAITTAAERRLAEQRRLREEADTAAAADAAADVAGAAAAHAATQAAAEPASETERGTGPNLRSVDEVA